MNEEQARQKIRAAYNKLRSYRGENDEPKLSTATTNRHIDTIYKAGNGEWSETIAKEYISNFEEQVEGETEASAPAFRRESSEDTITIEATDDPARELGISRRQFRDELDRFDNVDDSEDMREYIEDADDIAGEDERYRYRD